MRFCYELILTHKLDSLLAKLNIVSIVFLESLPPKYKDLYLFIFFVAKTNPFWQVADVQWPRLGPTLLPRPQLCLQGLTFFLLTLLALKLINIKFLLVLSMLYNFEILNPKATVLVEIS